jgi:hypothetical protein
MFSSIVIYKDATMDTLIQRTNKEKKAGKVKYPDPYEQPRVAIQRLRSTVGAFLYLKEDKVNEIFIAQVDRIGAQLEALEQALAKNPRKTKAGRGKGSTEVTFDAWKPMDLRSKWFKYMDSVYESANDKGVKFMEDNIKRLKAEYNDAKKITQADVDKENNPDEKKKKAAEKTLRDDMSGYITKLEAAWLKAKDWPKPKWNAKNTPPASPRAI